MTQPASIFTAHDIPDLLNALPTFFGFRPEESLVAVATHGSRRRFGFRLRVDIPEPEHVDALANLVVRHLRNHGADGAVVLAVTREQDVAFSLLAAIEDELDDIQPIVIARADGHRYWSDEPDFPCDGIPYDMCDHHVAIVHAVAAGQEILPDRAALVDRFRPVGEPRRTWLGHATRAAAMRVASQLSAPGGLSIAELGMSEVRPILDRGLAGERLSDGEVVLLCVWMSTMEVRDAVWGLMSRDNSNDMLRLLTLAAQHVVPPCEPGVLGLAAFAAWLTGDGAQSLIAAERALEADPNYSMAHIMLELLENGISPECWIAFGADDASAP